MEAFQTTFLRDFKMFETSIQLTEDDSSWKMMTAAASSLNEDIYIEFYDKDLCRVAMQLFINLKTLIDIYGLIPRNPLILAPYPNFKPLKSRDSLLFSCLNFI